MNFFCVVGRNCLGCCIRAANRFVLVSIEIDLVFVLAIDIDLLSVWGIELDLISVYGSELIWFCLGVENDLVLGSGSKLTCIFYVRPQIDVAS